MNPFRWFVRRRRYEAALADIARHRSQIADLHDTINEVRANIDEMRREADAWAKRLNDEAQALVDSAEVAAAESRNEADMLRRENVVLKGTLREAKEQTMEHWRRAEGLAAKVADLEAALAATQAEYDRQFEVADDAQDRVTNLEVELKLAVDTVRKLRETCNTSNATAMRTADDFLAAHTTPEIAAR